MPCTQKKLHQEVFEGKDAPALCSLVLCWLGFYKLDMNESHWEEKSFRWGTVFIRWAQKSGAHSWEGLAHFG